MDVPNTNLPPVNKSHTGAVVTIAVIIAVFISGGAVYAWQYFSSQAKDLSIQKLEQQVNSLTAQVTQLQQQQVEEEEEEQNEEDDLTTNLKNIFAVKYNKDVDLIEITVTDQTENHARGNVLFVYGPDDVDRMPDTRGWGAYFYATKVDNDWILVIDGNGGIPCELLTHYNFPADMKDQCYVAGDESWRSYLPYPVPADWQTYQNATYNYSMQYPADWEVSGSDNNVIIAYPGWHDDYPEGGSSLNVEVRDIITTADFIEEYNNIDPGVGSIINQELFYLGATSGTRLTGTTALGVNRDFVLFIKDNKSFVIRYLNPSQEHLTIIHSLKFID